LDTSSAVLLTYETAQTAIDFFIADINKLDGIFYPKFVVAGAIRGA
jgi:hypothetical protein